MNLFPSQLHPFKLHRKAVFAGALAAGCLLLSLSSAQAGSVFGDLRGFTRSAQGAPLPGVQVLVHSVEDNTDRNVVSNDQGAFRVENLRPGRYQLRATKEGLASSCVTTVDLAPQQDLRVEMILVPPEGLKGAANPNLTAEVHAPGVTGNLSAAPLTERERLLLERLDRLEQRLAALEAKEARGATPAATPAQPAPLASQPKTSATTVAATQPAPVASASASAAPAKPTLIASLDGAAGMKSAEKPSRLSVLPNTETASLSTQPLMPTVNAPHGSPAAAPPAVSVPQEARPDKNKKIDPFSDADWTWLNGNPRTKDIYWDTKFFTPEIRADVTYTYDFNHPADHSMGGSSEIFRTNEVQVEQLGVGGDFHYDNVRARLMTQFGMYSVTTPRNDPSPANGEWDLSDAYRYVSEAYGGYHFNVLHGINVDAGIFMSYVGLFSYYNFDNWAYQPSFVSSNTPWFFNGVRVQIFPTAHLKIEPWFINGWQSYASANHRPGLGGQVKWTPRPWLNLISNNYGLGHDDLYNPNRGRLHSDNSVEVKYYDQPVKTLDKMAFSFTGDLGCEFGGGVSCHGDTQNGPKQSFVGYMVYNRFWFHKDVFGLTLGGGQINNPGRYLVLLPPINGMTAASAAINSPYFAENPGDPFKAWDASLTFDWMPKQYITFRIEGDRRHASVPYWSGRGGITPPAFLGSSSGTPNGFPTEYACNNGTPVVSITGCTSSNGGLWHPDLRKDEFLIDFDIMVKF
jgi:hypothetical protein